ncbi:MAG: triose-phosphate isomerase [Clostridia bacterium BRH_c25]|nr:MAG: triose-phosphate isomerase [Clostridia bacterium BRH_c25]
MRKPLIAGNWKMNKTVSEAVKLVEDLKPLVKGAAAEVVVCPVFVCLNEAVKASEGSNIGVGAQNMYYKDSGAYTGEISPVFLKDMKVEYVILGHSERRQYFNESDPEINKKVIAALEHGLKPILCVGETLEQRETGTTFEVIAAQVKGCLAGLENRNLDDLIVAYEPVWAIGTGKTATSQDANEVIGFIRKQLAEILGNEVADKTRILYGGSVKSSNTKELMGMPEIDGALVGGASLDAAEFSKIVNYNS